MGRRAPTYARIRNGYQQERTMMGRKGEGIETVAETWKGRVRVYLDDDGDFQIFISEKYGNGEAMIRRGNVGDDPISGRHYIGDNGRIWEVDSAGNSAEAQPIIFQIQNPESLPEVLR